MSQPFTFDHVHIYSSQVEETAYFFKQAFGMTEIRRMANEDTLLVHLNFNGVRFVVSQCSEKNPQGVGHFAVTTNDLEAAAEEMEKYGLSISEMKSVSRFQNVFTKEPHSATIEIISPSTAA